MSGVPYLKMNGLGNDFVVVDARADGRKFTPDAVRAVTDRVKGVGADQFIVMEKPQAPGVDVFVRIYNSDGGEIDACGNARRCVAALVAEELGKRAVMLQTNAGPAAGRRAPTMLVTVDMGKPRFDWDQIPLAEEFADTTGIELQIGPIDAPILHTPSVAQCRQSARDFLGRRTSNPTISAASGRCSKTIRSSRSAPISSLRR